MGELNLTWIKSKRPSLYYLKMDVIERRDNNYSLYLDLINKYDAEIKNGNFQAAAKLGTLIKQASEKNIALDNEINLLATSN